MCALEQWKKERLGSEILMMCVWERKNGIYVKRKFHHFFFRCTFRLCCWKSVDTFTVLISCALCVCFMYIVYHLYPFVFTYFRIFLKRSYNYVCKFADLLWGILFYSTLHQRCTIQMYFFFFCAFFALSAKVLYYAILV